MMAGALALVASVPAAALPARYAGQVYPGTSVQGVKLNGLTRGEALARLRTHFTPFEQRAATIYFETNVWSATLADLGGSIDYDATLDKAMAHGRESVADRYTTFFAADDSVVIQPVITIDEAKTRDYLETLAPAIDIDARNARLFRSSGEIRMIDSVEGRALDRDAAVEALAAVMTSGSTGEVTLQTRVVAPEVTSAALEKNKSKAITLIGEAVALNHGDLVYTISAEQLAQALVIDKSNSPQIDPARLGERLDAIAADIFVAPTNVMLGWT